MNLLQNSKNVSGIRFNSFLGTLFGLPAAFAWEPVPAACEAGLLPPVDLVAIWSQFFETKKKNEEEDGRKKVNEKREGKKEVRETLHIFYLQT